jgi:hypothetical protein
LRKTTFWRRAIAAGGQHQVFDAHIGKGAAHHHLVVATARAVGVEIGLLYAVRQ